MLIKTLKVRADKPRTLETVLYANFSVAEGASFLADATQGTENAYTVQSATDAILAGLPANRIFDAIVARYNALEEKAKKAK